MSCQRRILEETFNSLRKNNNENLFFFSDDDEEEDESDEENPPVKVIILLETASFIYCLFSVAFVESKCFNNVKQRLLRATIFTIKANNN